MAKNVDLTDFDDAIVEPGAPLKVDVILSKLPDDKAASLRAALEAPDKYSQKTIFTVLSKWGVPASEGAIRTWRLKYLSR